MFVPGEMGGQRAWEMLRLTLATGHWHSSITSHQSPLLLLTQMEFLSVSSL